MSTYLESRTIDSNHVEHAHQLRDDDNETAAESVVIGVNDPEAAERFMRLYGEGKYFGKVRPWLFARLKNLLRKQAGTLRLSTEQYCKLTSGCNSVLLQATKVVSIDFRRED